MPVVTSTLEIIQDQKATLGTQIGPQLWLCTNDGHRVKIFLNCLALQNVAGTACSCSTVGLCGTHPCCLATENQQVTITSWHIRTVFIDISLDLKFRSFPVWECGRKHINFRMILGIHSSEEKESGCGCEMPLTCICLRTWLQLLAHFWGCGPCVVWPLAEASPSLEGGPWDW